ncbi:MAG: cyclic peptide export ABC transporter [Desulfobacterales bacterium]|nr:cyclic peptide export ABC transporter [Desulfobacterales bacterium]
MNIIKLYNRESTSSGAAVIFMAVISGVAQGVLLGIITIAASTASYEKLNFRYFILFAITFSIVVVGKRYALRSATVIAEEIIKRVRIRIAGKIRNSELLFLENVGEGELYTRIAQDTNLISESAAIIINASQSGIVLVFCIFFIAILSKLAFLITVLAIVLAIAKFLFEQRTIAEELRETTMREARFFEMLNQILKGFKELKMNRKKNDQHFESFKNTATETADLKIKTGFKFVAGMMASQVFFYSLIAIIVFVLPRLEQVDGGLIIRITAAILFIIGPVNLMVGAMPLFAKTNNSIANLYTLEERLDQASKPYRLEGNLPIKKIESFNEIRLENTGFSYCDRNGTPLFTVGPVNITIRRGEILFIVGGNGCGKSTLMKLLTGLYYPDSGTITLDDMSINKGTYPAYRELFSTIFSDFYLFDRLYGQDDIDYDKINDLLKLMGLDKKTEVINGEFTNIHLSTGQRKRLALIVSMLDDKEIYVFDEWAADQDPIFRKYFYDVLLKDLKKKGKTIIAVSHDDRYFHFADRVLKMEFGNFI